MTFKKGQEKVKVKTTGLAHNFIIIANSWNNDQRSMSNGSMNYGVYIVTPINGTMWENSKLFVTLQKGQEKVKTTGLVHNFIILTNGWKHNRRSKSNGPMSCSVHKVFVPQVFWMHTQMDGQTDGWIDRWMDRQMDGQTDGWTHRWMDGWSALPSPYQLHWEDNNGHVQNRNIRSILPIEIHMVLHNMAVLNPLFRLARFWLFTPLFW